MRVADLNPGWCSTSIDGVSQFWFTCPECGPPYRVLVCVTLGASSGGIWQWNHVDPLCAPWDGPLTLTPSIWNHHHGHKKSCNWHGSIINGEIIPPVHPVS